MRRYRQHEVESFPTASVHLSVLLLRVLSLQEAFAMLAEDPLDLLVDASLVGHIAHRAAASLKAERPRHRGDALAIVLARQQPQRAGARP
jgi:hypothetical protein